MGTKAKQLNGADILAALGLRYAAPLDLGVARQGDSFDRPWDPTVNASLSHGNPSDTFIGEYFGSMRTTRRLASYEWISRPVYRNFSMIG
jgi:hypothetical protein